MKELTDEDFRFTTRGDTIYVFTGDLPENEVIIKSLSGKIFRSFKTVEMLGIEEPLQFIQDDEALKVAMPDSFPCAYSVCLKLTS
jgi:alpha-L-fucosidase